MTNLVQNQLYNDLLQQAIGFSKDPNLPSLDNLTLINVLLDELVGQWGILPDTTKATLLGIVSCAMREAVRTGEYQHAIASVLQQAIKH